MKIPPLAVIGLSFALTAAAAPLSLPAPTVQQRLVVRQDDLATLQSRCTTDLARLSKMETGLTRLASQPVAKFNAKALLTAWDDLGIALEYAQNGISLMSQVHPDQALRSAAEACDIELGKFGSKLLQNTALYRAFKQRAQAPELDRIERKLMHDTLLDFADTGVDLAPDKRQRVKAIRDEIDKLAKDYRRNVRDNNEKLVFSADELKGLPQDYLNRAKRDGNGNYLLGFAYPEFLPFMDNADDEAARKRFQIAFTRRGGAANLLILQQALQLRQELAQLEGFANYAQLALRRRMAKTPEAVSQFLAEVKAAVRLGEQNEIAELRAFKASSLGSTIEQTTFSRWDSAYWQNRLKKQRYSYDEEQLRAYFPTATALAWTLNTSGLLYGIEFRAVKLPVWHEDVQYYDVYDRASQQRLGGLYLDLYPRAGKYGHAAVWPIYGSATRIKRLPVAALVTNFNRQGLNADELETLVHEFGHAMHGLLSNTRYASQAGTSVERDFVEAPSQMFEEWARRFESLATLSKLCAPQCPQVTQELVGKMTAAHNFGRGMRYARQWLYASYDMQLHQMSKPDPLKVWQEMESATPLGYVAESQFPTQFDHLFGYGAGYYGYMWSEVIALDLLNAYQGNLLNPQVGARFRRTLLAQGSQKSGMEMTRKFLGRAPDTRAFYDELLGQRLR